MTYAWIQIGDGREVYRKETEPNTARSGLPTPMVISDRMDATEHPCDGRHYESKSAFRRVTKANNCIEIGNDPARFRKFEPPKPDRKAIRETIKKAANRVKNG